MGRLTIDVPDNTHLHLKVMAASRGVTIKDYLLEKIQLDLGFPASEEVPLSELAASWEKRRKEFRLERGKRSFGDVAHEGHKW